MITLGVGPTDITDNDGGADAQVTLVGTTAGRSLAVCVRWLNPTTTLSSISCSGESDLTLHTRAFESGSSRSVQWGTLNNITSGGDKTITANFSAGTFHAGVVAIEIVGGDISDIFDAVANATGSSTNPTVNLTTGAAGNAILAVVSTNAAAEPDPGSGYTRIVLGQTTGFAEGEYDLDAGSAGSKTVDFSALTGSWALSAIALNVGPNVTVSATGVSATGATGNPSVSGGAGVSPSGVAATGNVGTVLAGTVTNVSVTGVSATGSVGTAIARGAAVVNVTGVQATGFVGAESVQFPMVHAFAEHEAPVGYEGYFVQHEAPVGYFFLAEHEAVYSLMGPQRAEHEASYDLMTRALAVHEALYDLKLLNPGFVEHEACWSLLAANVSIVTQRPFLEWQGERLDLLDASAVQDEGGQFWTVRVQLAKAADYLRLSRFDAIELDIFGDRYDLVIESLGRGNDKIGVDQTFDISCRSRLWATLGDTGNRVTKSWPAVSARAAVEELAGEAVDWRIIDWQIPAGRLAAVNETPISVIARIVSPGAVVESAKDGGLIVRWLYPVSIPLAAGAAVDHEFTEAGEIFSLTERLDQRQVYDKLTLTDRAGDAGYLAAERDPDQPDVIFGGEEQRFLVYHSDDVEVREVILSAGSLLERGTSVQPIEEEITFANTDEAEVSRIATSDFAFVWYGTGLGLITLGADKRKLIASAAGVGIARVNYNARARRYAVLSPATLGGRSEFPIVVYVIGALREDESNTGAGMRIVVQRGAGLIPGDDVIIPLAGNENVLLNHGRNLIDAGAVKGAVSLRKSYPIDASGPGHVMNGELIKIADSQLGLTWRGKVKTIEHRIETDRRTGAVTVGSTLAAERFI